MDLPIKVFDIELVGGRSNVALFIPVSPEKPVDVGDEKIMPDIKFPFLVEKWPIKVKLNYESFLYSIVMLALSFDNLVQLICLIYDSYSMSSIC